MASAHCETANTKYFDNEKNIFVLFLFHIFLGLGCVVTG